LGFAVIIRYLGGLSFAAVTESAVQGHYPVLRERQLPPFRGGSKTIHRKYDEDATGRKQPWSSYLKWSITIFQRNPRSVNDLKYCTNFMQRLKQPRLSSIRLHWPRVFNKVIRQSGDDSENLSPLRSLFYGVPDWKSEELSNSSDDYWPEADRNA
jgi:hypothetical protein